MLLFGLAGSLLRLSRRDFGLLPVLEPLDFHGTSPNFLVCAGMPLNAFCFKHMVSLSSYAKTAFGTALGLSIYEVLQIYMPRRTFDPYDVLASFLGAIFSVMVASVLFFRQRQIEKTIDQALHQNRRPPLRFKNHLRP